MIFSIILSVIFLIAAVHNLTQGDYENAVVGMGLSFVLAALFFFDRRQKKKINAFMMWLMENKEELKSDDIQTLMWNDIPVRYDSYVTQYHFCTSFVIVTFKQPTGFLLDRSPDRLLVNFIASFVTVLAGWWGIPFGPIYTIQTIFRNLRGGVKRSIQDLIAELENAEQGAGADGENAGSQL